MKELLTKVSERILRESTYSKEKSDKHGEVFTPPELINEMLDKLPQEIFSDPTKTFFDPCAGKGNFPIYIVKKLFVHLQEHIVDEEERLKHIVEKQLFMAELQPESAEFIREAFSFGKGFKVNLYEGNALEMPEDYFDYSLK
jgi:type I restriction-modification system DNA methylase subunit